MIIAIIIVALLALFLVRSHWISWQLERYTILATYWCLRTKQGVVVADEMSNLWPLFHLHFHLFHWNLRHFVVYQDHYDAMTEWVEGELKRTDLDWETLAKEVSEVEGEPPASAPALASALADPSRN